MLRAIQEIKPKFVIAENVFGITNIDGGLVFEQVCLDLENEGYEVQPYIIPAASKNAPHRRDRCWFVAFKNSMFSGCIHGESNEKGTEVREFGNISTGSTDGVYLSEGNATNTNLSGCKTKRKQSKPTTQDKRIKYCGSRWEQFPIQSPICGGDDGLPSKLDGITFSKWRAESIKGYGNAIVPQVALELFKIIETI
jgi:DNA (cytosine-5)-methyltransferase 1